MYMRDVDCEDWVADAGGATYIPSIEEGSVPSVASSCLVDACDGGLKAGVGFACRRTGFFAPGFFATGFLATGFGGVGICIPGMLMPWCCEWSCAGAGWMTSNEADAAKTAARRISVPLPSAARSRSEARRVGKECVSTWRSRWSPSH